MRLKTCTCCRECARRRRARKTEKARGDLSLLSEHVEHHDRQHGNVARDVLDVVWFASFAFQNKRHGSISLTRSRRRRCCRYGDVLPDRLLALIVDLGLVHRRFTKVRKTSVKRFARRNSKHMRANTATNTNKPAPTRAAHTQQTDAQVSIDDGA